MRVVYNENNLPVLRSGDAVIAGGSLAGVASALELARAGKKVVLVEPRTYLGREVSALLRPWLPADTPGVDLEPLATLRVRAGKVPNARGEIPLHMDEVKRCLEDLLLEAGVEIVYASIPVGMAGQADHISGVVIGNKSGRQVVRGEIYVDATETALLARLAGMPIAEDERVVWTRNLDFDRVAPFEQRVLGVPCDLGIFGDLVEIHPGYRQGYTVVAASFDLPTVMHGLEAFSWREMETRDRCMRLASWLVHNVPEFSQAYLGSVAYELGGLYTRPLPALDWPGLSSELVPFATPWPRLWLLNCAVRTADRGVFDLPAAAQYGCQLGSALSRHWNGLVGRPGGAFLPGQNPPVDPGDVEICEPVSPQRGRQYALHPAAATELPVLDQSDILVVGGGTSGAIAAYASALEGASAMVVEMNPGLGGTGTYGGVHSYWCGFRGGFVPRIKRWVNQVHRQLGLGGLKGSIPVWNMDAKAYALEKNLRKKGVRCLYHARVIGTLKVGNTVCGVVAATRLGPVALLAKITLDASGDGDVAAFAGAEFSFGSSRDHLPMWYILPQFYLPGRNRNHFSSPVDVTNIEDYNRAILSGRRRGNLGEDHDHGQYIATRESRHVVGDVILSMTDQLLHRAWEDVVCIAFSNNDIKGQISSEWFRTGLIPPHLEIEIPYRALLPKGLENILVVGKAVSAAHDAMSAIRMQSDLENQGGVGGLAAALALKTGATARGVEITSLQSLARKYRILPERFIRRRLIRFDLSGGVLQAVVRSLSSNKPLHAYSKMPLLKVFEERIPFVDALCAGPQVVPLLEAELAAERQPARKLLLAQALAMAGSRAGVPVLVNQLERLFSSGSLPVLDFAVRHMNRYAPDQAAMPLAAYLLFSLGEARDPRALPVWERLVSLLSGASQEDIWNQRTGTFYYIDAVCVGAEKLADARAAPLLSKLHALPFLHSQQLTHGFQVDFLLERLAYLEVVIGRALARCGSAEGVVTLINYLQDVRAPLAEQAHSELTVISGQDYGKDPAAWGQWLELKGDSLPCVPWNDPSDAVRTWEEEILIAVDGS